LERVIADLQAREARGLGKYATTVDRTDLKLRDWLQHLYEELLDAAVYARRQIDLLDGRR
jgi:hypothetical protein